MSGVNTKTKPHVTNDCDAARQFVNDARQSGQNVGVVMTMGALHAGHLSLVEAANRQCDVSVVTIFVNPIQFGPDEDLANYPRRLEADVAELSSRSVDMVFCPSDDQMVGPGHSTLVQPPKIAEPWEGRCRPGHFQGVATIVLKLLHVIPAHVAFFGQKDYQQFQVIRQMVRELHLPVQLKCCPTVRDEDGLALSSRNVHLDENERTQSLALSRGLSLAAELYEQGEQKAGLLAARIRSELISANITRIDYVALVDPTTLVEVSHVDADTIGLIAAFVGSTRLIDNHRLGAGPIVSRPGQ
jgi:pantoate--beta-alanine ligase